ncbi:MAG: glycoside hydrolase family 3 C-terminal domain-containing protein [Acidimicrobiales bacterium]
MPTLSADVEVLLAELTLSEKINLVAGADLWHTVAIERLGIPALRVSDGPAGVRGTTFTGHTSASFPCPTALGATFDAGLVEEIARAIGEEAVSKGASMLLAPTVNLHRTPVGGRNFECFSEDPVLTAAMAVAYVRGVQSQGVAACVKHFAANDTETERMTVSSEVTEQVLREVYLLPFESAIHQADARAVMSAYNRVNGTYCAEHRWLLTEVLKGQWGFDGVVVSDWWGTKSTVASAVGGLDLEMPGPPRYFGDALAAAIDRGELDPAVVDDKVRRLLRWADWAGRLGTSGPPLERSVDVPGHREIIRRAAAAGTVLLRNEGGLLPLDPGDLGSVALIGPAVVEVSIQGGGSAQVNPHHLVTPLDALRRALPTVALVHEPGCSIHRGVPPVRGRFDLSYTDGDDPEGPVVGTATVTQLRLTWLGSPGHGVAGDSWSMRASGRVTVDAGGLHRFTLTSAGRARVRIDGDLLLDNGDGWTRGSSYFGAGSTEVGADIALDPGDHDVVVEFQAFPAAAVSGVTVGHRPPQADDLFERAVAAAAAAEVCVVVAGTNAEWESEGSDRTTLSLPGRQDELIEAVARVNPRTVVVLNAGSPVAMPWAENVAAICQTWFPGQEAGDALADVLVGRSDPGGRLPVTIPCSLRDTPAYVSHPPLEGRALYGEGLFVGHRWYDARGIEPRYPFGFGLSYTSFSWGEPRVVHRGVAVDVIVPVTNTGRRRGREVVQAYVSVVEPARRRPERVLAGFAATELAAGESVEVTVPLDARSWSHWGAESGEWEPEAGGIVAMVARSSRDIVASLEIVPGRDPQARL